MVIIGLITWTGIARFIRAELLRVRQLDFIDAAQSMGFSELRILFRHAIPNSLTPVLITIAFGIASAILIEAFLSFLGIGVSPSDVTWGSLLNLSRDSIKAWWLAILPGSAIFITVSVFNLIGEGLSDALNPKLRQ
jgi:peptide/nickel transport system permease protein